MEKNENGYALDGAQRNAGSCNPGGMTSPARGTEGCSEGLQLAMVYSPYQSWRKLLNPDEALKHGTLFEELYKPLQEVCDE